MPSDAAVCLPRFMSAPSVEEHVEIVLESPEGPLDYLGHLIEAEGAFAGCEYGVSTGLPLEAAITASALNGKALVNPGLPA